MQCNALWPCSFLNTMAESRSFLKQRPWQEIAKKQRRKGGCAGGNYLDCQRSGPIPVGMGLGFHRAAPGISYHVRDPSW